MKINLQVYFTTEYTFQNDRKIVSVVLKYKNHYLLKKRGGKFSCIFHSLLIDISKKIYETFFHKFPMPCGYV